MNFPKQHRSQYKKLLKKSHKKLLKEQQQGKLSFNINLIVQLLTLFKFRPSTTPKAVASSTQGNTYLPPDDNTTPKYRIGETTKSVVVTKSPSIERTAPSKFIETATKKSTPGPSYLPIEQPSTVPRSYVTRSYKPATYVPISYKVVSSTPYPTYSRRSTTTQILTTTPQYLYRRPVKEFKDGN